MNEKDFLLALQQMRDKSKARKFVQSVELIINFKDLDFKKPDNQIDIRVNLPHPTGKSAAKTLLFAKNKNFVSLMKGKVNKIIEEEAIAGLNKKEINNIINDFDLLIAEKGSVLLSVAKHLGQQLAPKGKMPKPIDPSSGAIEDTLKQLSSLTRVTNQKAKPMPLVQVLIGNEKMQDKQLGENALAILNSVLNQLPNKKQNVKSVFVKLTMGPPIKVEGKKG